jgi:hypothetical protein
MTTFTVCWCLTAVGGVWASGLYCEMVLYFYRVCVFAESSYNVSDVEGQLLAVYEPVVIRDLLTDLYENRGLHPSQIIALNDRVS